MKKPYKPNFNDPRVIARIETAWNHALACLSETKPRDWDTRQIDKWFGQQQNKLGGWIRQQVLIVHNQYYNPETGKTKSYLLNLNGLLEIGSYIGKVQSKNIPCALQLNEYKVQAADNLFGKTIESNAFEYTEKSNRLWNHIQHISNDIRVPLFKNYGYVHEYDIKSAAPTILTQYARQCDLTRPIKTIDEYLKDPEYFREYLMNLLGVDRKTAKTLITSRFAGARFGNRNAILKELDNKWILHDRLKNDPWFDELSKDIIKLWEAIKKFNEVGKLNSKKKWSIYFQEEYRVMKSTHAFLKKNSVLFFHEHDGWRSTSSIEVRALQLHIQKQTGYWVEFDHDIVV